MITLTSRRTFSQKSQKNLKKISKSSQDFASGPGPFFCHAGRPMARVAEGVNHDRSSLSVKKRYQQFFPREGPDAEAVERVVLDPPRLAQRTMEVLS
jgi:hypothetical protein